MSLCACGAKHTSTPQDSNQKSTDLSMKVNDDFLSGNWVFGCQSDPKTDLSMTEFLQFDGGNANRISTWYLAKDCTQPLYQRSLNSTYVISGSGKYSETRTSVSLIPYSSVALGLFKHYDGCGTDWKLNEEQTFTDEDMRQCDVELVENMQLSAKTVSGVTELQMHLCEKRNADNCVDYFYYRR